MSERTTDVVLHTRASDAIPNSLFVPYYLADRKLRVSIARVEALIASVYIGFAVADGRPRIIAIECGVAALFVLLASTAIVGGPWLLVVGYAGHGLKDLWQHRTHFVRGTRWWPPFCVAVDWFVAFVIAIEIIGGVHFR